MSFSLGIFVKMGHELEVSEAKGGITVVKSAAYYAICIDL